MILYLVFCVWLHSLWQSVLLQMASFCSFMAELPWCSERLKAGGEGDDRGWDGWMASLTQWTWVWVNSGSRWWAGRPCVLQSMGLQRIGHGWATEPNWIFHCIYIYVPCLLYPFLHWWTFCLFLCPGYCKSCYSEHWGACIFFELWFSLGVWPGIAGSYSRSIFSIVGIPIYIPTKRVGGFPFLRTVSNTVCRFFDDGHFDSTW